MNRRLIVMGSIAVLLAIYVVSDENGLVSNVRNMSETPREKPSNPEVRSNAVTKLNPLEGMDANSFVTIIERPLFNPSRMARPPAPPAIPLALSVPEPQPEPEEIGLIASDYKLLAVSSGPAGRVAAVRLVSTDEVIFLREGQQLQSWSVFAVEPRSVTIGTADQRIELGMFEGGASSTSDGPTPSDNPDAATPPGKGN